jgi:hypothetical protein
VHVKVRRVGEVVTEARTLAAYERVMVKRAPNDQRVTRLVRERARWWRGALPARAGSASLGPGNRPTLVRVTSHCGLGNPLHTAAERKRVNADLSATLGA